MQHGQQQEFFDQHHGRQNERSNLTSTGSNTQTNINLRSTGSNTATNVNLTPTGSNTATKTNVKPIPEFQTRLTHRFRIPEAQTVEDNRSVGQKRKARYYEAIRKRLHTQRQPINLGYEEENEGFPNGGFNKIFGKAVRLTQKHKEGTSRQIPSAQLYPPQIPNEPLFYSRDIYQPPIQIFNNYENCSNCSIVNNTIDPSGYPLQESASDTQPGYNSHVVSEVQSGCVSNVASKAPSSCDSGFDLEFSGGVTDSYADGEIPAQHCEVDRGRSPTHPNIALEVSPTATTVLSSEISTVSQSSSSVHLIDAFTDTPNIEPKAPPNRVYARPSRVRPFNNNARFRPFPIQRFHGVLPFNPFVNSGFNNNHLPFNNPRYNNPRIQSVINSRFKTPPPHFYH